MIYHICNVKEELKILEHWLNMEEEKQVGRQTGRQADRGRRRRRRRRRGKRCFLIPRFINTCPAWQCCNAMASNNSCPATRRLRSRVSKSSNSSSNTRWTTLNSLATESQSVPPLVRQSGWSCDVRGIEEKNDKTRDVIRMLRKWERGRLRERT